MSALNIFFYLVLGAIAICLYAAYVRHKEIQNDMLRDLRLVSRSSEQKFSAKREDDMSERFFEIKSDSQEEFVYRVLESGFYVLESAAEAKLDLIGDGLPRQYEDMKADPNNYLFPGQSASA